jgi:hypothetical protein
MYARPSVLKKLDKGTESSLMRTFPSGEAASEVAIALLKLNTAKSAHANVPSRRTRFLVFISAPPVVNSFLQRIAFPALQMWLRAWPENDRIIPAWRSALIAYLLAALAD